MTDNHSTQDNGQPSVVAFPGNDSIDDQAAQWVAKLDTDSPSRETVTQFKQWLNQSPEHKASFEKYQALWSGMNVLTEIVPPVKEPGQEAASFMPWWQTQWSRSLVAGFALLLIVIVFNSGGQHYRTAVGEQKTVVLDDGTSVLMNTDTELRVDYSDSRRKIILIRGEAHFDIAHNPERPFDVVAGMGGVRAIGTAFSVYLRTDDVEVVVTEGTVEILTSPEADQSPPAGQQLAASDPAATKLVPKPTRVTAGNIVTYDRHTAEHVMQQALGDSADKLSWHKGLLVFRGEPLENVIAQVNRYTTLKIVIPDQTVRDLKVGGFFKVSDIESVFQALEEGFDIYAEPVSAELVYLVYRGQ